MVEAMEMDRSQLKSVLQELARSQEWAVFSSLVQQQGKLRNQERASALRRGDLNKAMMAQATLDAYDEILALLDKTISSLSLTKEDEPAY